MYSGNFFFFFTLQYTVSLLRISSSQLARFSHTQVPVEPDIDDHLFPTVDSWDRFDPYNQFERYNDPNAGEGEVEREEKPWWWNYFSQSGVAPPHWLLRNV